MIALAIEGLVPLGAGAAYCLTDTTDPIDVGMRCFPTFREMTYRCEVQIVETETGFALSTHGGTIHLETTSGPQGHPLSRIVLDTAADGRLRDVEVNVPRVGEWRVVFRVGTSVIAKRVKFQRGAKTET